MLFEYSVEDWVGRRDGKSVYPRERQTEKCVVEKEQEGAYR
jgi:hypothetical protein